MGRWLYALKHGWIHRAKLKQFLTDRKNQIHTLEEITAKGLDESLVAVLALDFDGVLAAHDADSLSPRVEAWLQKLAGEVGEQRIAILTNKPKQARLRYFKEKFPSIHVVQGIRKKPYPDGLWEIANYKGVSPHRVLLLDDRLLTGMLATCLCYTQGWYFPNPEQNFWRHPIKEAFFSFLRAFERMLVRVFG